MKDVFPRYKSMRGFDVPRKAGWDTHGLPVEIEVEKELRISGKDAIVEYGVEPFVRRCLDSVFRYTEEWAQFTEKLGFWVDLDDAYVTYHQSYVESVWWALSQLHAKGLLYRGHKVVWWWAQGGTVLSAAEVGEGYKTVDDPSVYVRFPLRDDPGTSLLVWTTTPWTLPSNSLAAVKLDVDYAVVRDGEQRAHRRRGAARDPGREGGSRASRRAAALAAPSWSAGPTRRPSTGSSAIAAISPTGGSWGRISSSSTRAPASSTWRRPSARWTSTCCAASRSSTPTCRSSVRSSRTAASIPRSPTRPTPGRWVKDCDRDLTRELEERGLLWHLEQIRHEYPFCVRSDEDPLIQFARPAWYIRTTAHVDEALANNDRINWLPEHIKEGRFGDFLRNNVDWALSRERFWGTPLNIWINDETGATDAPASVAEILERNPRAFDAFDAALERDPSLSPHLSVHKPWIDDVTWTKPGEPGVYRRVPEVIDAWFDSGSMPFAQWGYPHTGSREFEAAFPGGLHLRGDRPDARLVQLAAVGLDAALPRARAPAPLQDLHRARARRRPGRQEGVEEQGQLHAARDHPRPRSAGVRRGRGRRRGARDRLRDRRPRGLRGARPARRQGEGAGLSRRRPDRAAARSSCGRASCRAGSSRSRTPIARPSASSSRPPAWARSRGRCPAFRWRTRSGSRTRARRRPAPTRSAGSSTPRTRRGIPRAIRSTACAAQQRELPLKLRNVYAFFTIYANIDGFDPG